jgi:dTDP-4-dehydrorhamnose 3,5-epimerase-like enzyme
MTAPSGVFNIHDLYARPISSFSTELGESWPLLRFEDHLLGRFGLAELVRALPGASAGLRARSAADEIWILIEGTAEIVWRDTRSGSPTQGREDRLEYSEPTLVLVPFGVAFGFRARNGPATLLRIATHAEGEDEDIAIFPWESA